jgi:CheY-like chemotaxis protein
MPDRLTVEMTSRPPHAADLPLSGVTVLVVDDSRLACDGLRLMCRRLGARLRRAESLQAAEVHLRVYRPDVVIIDLGLPDGRGEALIRRLALAASRPVVLGLSGDGNGRWTSMAAGADGYLDKPLESLAQFQTTLLGLLPMRAVSAAALPDLALPPDPLALRDDLAYAARLLDHAPDASTRHYLAGFLGGVARQAHDRPLADAALRAPSKGLRDALQARLALPDQAFAQVGLPLVG